MSHIEDYIDLIHRVDELFGKYGVDMSKEEMRKSIGYAAEKLYRDNDISEFELNIIS